MQSGTGQRQEEGLCVMVERAECKYIQDGSPKVTCLLTGLIQVAGAGLGSLRLP